MSARLAVVLSAAALVTSLLAAAPTVEAAATHVIGRNAVGSQHIRSGAILPRHLSAQTRAWIIANAPPVRARGVTVTAGAHGDRVRVTGATISRGDVLGQIEYLGGLTCPNLGPYLTADATFFDTNGVIVDTGSDLETQPVAGVRYPVRIIGTASAVRAEVVASVTCI